MGCDYKANFKCQCHYFEIKVVMFPDLSSDHFLGYWKIFLCRSIDGECIVVTLAMSINFANILSGK